MTAGCLPLLFKCRLIRFTVFWRYSLDCETLLFVCAERPSEHDPYCSAIIMGGFMLYSTANVDTSQRQQQKCSSSQMKL